MAGRRRGEGHLALSEGVGCDAVLVSFPQCGSAYVVERHEAFRRGGGGRFCCIAGSKTPGTQIQRSNKTFRTWIDLEGEARLR